MSLPLIQIKNLKTHFYGDDVVVKAVNDISFEIKSGYTLGLVGESGSGKSVTSLSIMRLLPLSAAIHDSQIAFLGRNLVKLPEKDMCDIRGSEISMIFQEPGTSLNPVYQVGAQVIEAIMLHQKVSKEEAVERTIELFREVGIPEPERRIFSYPHEMSGGQKQRVMIAMALSCNPKLLIADEPTTALDVTIQKQILNLIRKLRDERGMAILFITHDLGVIAEIADEVAVMFRGKIVERKDVVSLFENPEHPYTKGLLACRPQLESKFKRLPVVSDYMDYDLRADGTADIIEKSVDPERIIYYETHGRGRLLNKRSELKALGFDKELNSYARDATCIPEDDQPLLSVDHLKVHFPIKAGVLKRTVGYIKAVDGIRFDIYRGQTLGLVGESGCGKTTAGRAILQLIRPTSGVIKYKGEEVNSQSIKSLRGKMQVIFQDPYASLNPRLTIESMLIEAMAVHKLGSSKQDRRDRAANLLEEVGMLPEHLKRYPHEFSGGQRQRICIARALAVEPEFIICDESVSALDVSVQAQVLNLLNDLQESRGLTYIFISHDLSVVKFMADMMAVMKEGRIVEYGPSEAIYRNPKEEYTRSLIEATPCDDLENIRRLVEHRKQLRST